MFKKIIIIVISIILLFSLYYIYITNKTNKEILYTWSKIEKDFNEFNDIVINFYKVHDKKINILYINDDKNEIVSNDDPTIKVNLSNKDMELFNRVKEYYYRELAYEGREMDIIHIYDTYILYVTESRYFGIIYSRDGKEHKYRDDVPLYHIKDNWYFQTLRNDKMFK